jgi:uncharacterized protein (DUF1697 family)
MHALRHAFESLGFSGVATFLASGNVVFETGATNVEAPEQRIRRSLQQVLGYPVSVFIRTNPEPKAIVAFEPFENSQIRGADLNIILLAEDLEERSKVKLRGLATQTDGFRVHGREIYWWRRKRPGTALYSTVPLAKVLPQPFTIRSTNTMRRLAAKWPCTPRRPSS